MARVEPNQPSVRQIAQVRFRPCRNKERIVPAPDDQRSGPMRAECRMPGLVGRNIGLVVLQQIELGQINARAVQQGLVDGPVIGADRCGVAGADQILEFCCSGCEDCRAPASLASSRFSHSGRKIWRGMSPTPSM